MLYNSLFRLKANNFCKFPSLKFKINKVFYNTSSDNKFIINNNVVLNIKSIDTNMYKSNKLNKKVANTDILNDSWDHIKKYDHVCINLHQNDLVFIDTFINNVNDGKNKNKYLTRRIRKQYNEYITIMNAVNKYNKNYFLFGLNRKSELSSFGDVAMSNKVEIAKLFYLILAHTNNLLNSDKSLGELERLCPNIYKLVVVDKSKYYLQKLMGFISGLNPSKRVDVLVILDKYIEPRLTLLLHQITASNVINSSNATLGGNINNGFSSVTNDRSTGSGVSCVDVTEVPLMEDLSYMEGSDMKNWSLFLLFYIFLPLTGCLLLIVLGVSRYAYNLKKSKFVSITIPDDLSTEPNSERNRKLKLNRNIQFYNPQRD